MNGLSVRLGAAFVAVSVASIVAAASLILVGVVCYDALRTVTPPAAAGLLTAGGGLIVALLLLAGGRALMLRSRASSAPPQQEHGFATEGLSAQDKMVAELGGLLGAQLINLIRTRPRETAVGSLAAGFALGASPKLRDFIRKLL